VRPCIRVNYVEIFSRGFGRWSRGERRPVRTRCFGRFVFTGTVPTHLPPLPPPPPPPSAAVRDACFGGGWQPRAHRNRRSVVPGYVTGAARPRRLPVTTVRRTPRRSRVSALPESQFRNTRINISSTKVPRRANRTSSSRAPSTSPGKIVLLYTYACNVIRAWVRL